ncbi:MAG: SDR family oxidoreductase [Protaetiibacter sp.]
MTGIGPVALVTGGGTGIGRAVAERLVAAGAERVYLNYSRSADAAEEVADALRARGAEVSAIRADIADAAAVRGMLARIEAEAGRLDHLVNNAGVTELIPFPDLDAVTAEVWERLWRVNVLGTFEVTRAAAGLLRAAEGSVVNIASIAGRRAVGSSLPYGVTKAAVVQLTRSLAVALAPRVRVNAISAGTVRTGWHDRLVGEEAARKKAEAEATVVPLGRLADAGDIAEAVVAVLGLGFTTGEDILVDGGKGLLY